MRTTAIVSAAALIGLSVTAPESQALSAASTKIAPEVQDAMAALPAGQQVSVIVHLNTEADLKPFRGLGRAKRLAGVVRALRAKSDGAQGRLRGLLRSRKTQGSVASYTPLWVINGLAVTAGQSVVEELASYPEVAAITSDEVPIVPAALPPATVEPNLSAISVPGLWDLGLYGQGIVIAEMDSGVDIGHPELGSTWRGGTNSWYDPYGQHPTTPTDRSGHGTWTMGVMAAADTSATAIGIAPLARWIAVKIFNDAGTATATAIHKGFQWLLDPDGNPNTADAPDVVNNSWSYGSPGCNLAFQPDVQALRAAGILPIFAAGNFGPGSQTSISPANYPEAFAVGAMDNADTLYPYSSKGPSTCGGSTTVYPDLVAPGVDIQTTDLFGLYAAETGTSMAAPHVTGALALLLEAYPNLDVDQQAAALTNSAVDLGVAGPDNSFGYGGLDALAAYDWVTANGGNPPPPPDTTGPTASNAAASPSPTNGTGTVVFTATLTDAVSNVGAAEGFVDSVGAAGTGLPFYASDGAFDSLSEAVYANPATAQLGEGSHTLYVRGQDAAANWGAPSSATLIIDKTGPAAGSVQATPSPSNGAASATLTALVTDSVSGIAAAEWFEGADPGLGLGKPMTASDGAFNTQAEAVTASVTTTGLVAGNHTLSVRAKDAAGNWGAASSTVLAVSAATSDVIFADGFESGSLSAWSSVVDSVGSLGVSGAAKANGVYGLGVAITAGKAGYVVDTRPGGSTSYHARFYFDPNSVSATSTPHDIFVGANAANKSVFRVQMRRSGSSYQLGATVSRSGGTTRTSWYTVTDAYHAVEIAWQAGGSATFSLYIDGGLKQTLTGLNTSTFALSSVRLGPQGTLSTVSGKEYFDAFASTRSTVVGP